MDRLRSAITRHPIWWTAGAGIMLAAIAFGVGLSAGDDSVQVSALESELADVEGERNEARSERADLVVAEGERADEVESLEEELSAERALSGKSESKQKAPGEYDTDYDWEAAGTVGYLVLKPVGFEQEGDKWILTVEAKNEGKEPKEPFCGGAGGVVIDAEDRNYSGEAVLSESSDNCGEALQPGLTGIYKSEFKLPSGAVPVGLALYGDYEQEEEAKTWELPH